MSHCESLVAVFQADNDAEHIAPGDGIGFERGDALCIVYKAEVGGQSAVFVEREKFVHVGSCDAIYVLGNDVFGLRESVTAHCGRVGGDCDAEGVDGAPSLCLVGTVPGVE